MESLCIIPARGGSKTVPGKNIRIVSGKPLIGYAIESVLDADAFDKTVLSTDSSEIAEVVRIHYPDIEIPFIRDAALADDNTSLVSVAKHAMDFFGQKGVHYDLVFSIQPTNPFVKPETILRSVEILTRPGCDSVVSITKILHGHPFRAYGSERDGGAIFPLTEYTSEKLLQKQDRPDAFGFTGGIYGRKRHLLERWNMDGFALGKNVRGVWVSQEEGFDIDTPFDMETFEGIVRMRASKEEDGLTQ